MNLDLGGLRFIRCSSVLPLYYSKTGFGNSQWPEMMLAGWCCLQLLLDQMHNNNTEFGWVVVVGDPTHYVVTLNHIEVEMGL